MLTLNLNSKLGTWTHTSPGLSAPFSHIFWEVDLYIHLSTQTWFRFSPPTAGTLPFQISIQPPKSLHLRQTCSNTGTLLAALPWGSATFSIYAASAQQIRTHPCTQMNWDIFFGKKQRKQKSGYPTVLAEGEGIAEGEGRGREQSCQMQLQHMRWGQTEEKGQVLVGWSKLCSLFTLWWWNRKVGFYIPWHIRFIYMYFKSPVSLQLRLPVVSSLLTSRLLNSIHAYFLSFERSVPFCRGCC